MKLNKNFLSVISSINMIVMAILYGVLIVIMTFYPTASWIQMVFAGGVLIAINALLLLKDKNQESILSEINEMLKTGEGLDPNKEEK